MKPFLKWAGGKRQLLPELTKYVPSEFGRYYEPFVGAGALFFSLEKRVGSVLSDTNERLIVTYRAVRDRPDAVISLLHEYAANHCEEYFYAVRGYDTGQFDHVGLAAWLIYLNKTCFNGLYRVNKKGVFNTPFGDYKNPTICDASVIWACSVALQNVDLFTSDFEEVVSPAKAGDFVYFDSPYAPLTETSNFTAYTKAGFSKFDQTRLRDCALRLKQRGVHVLLTNSSAPLIYDLYSQNFEITEVNAKRAINSKGSKRGEIKELIIR